MKNASGKLLIIGILTAAVAAAGASWWFRYSATHRTLQFWGPETAQLIRDAPKVSLRVRPFATPIAANTGSPPTEPTGTSAIDVSNMHGLVHLRNALLEDRSFDWQSQMIDSGLRSLWILTFYEPRTKQSADILISNDGVIVGRMIDSSDGTMRLEKISAKPIAPGLVKFFTEAAATNGGAAR